MTGTKEALEPGQRERTDRSTSPPRPAASTERRQRLLHALAGFFVTIFIWRSADALGLRGLNLIPKVELLPLLALAGAVIGLTRLRALLWVLLALLASSVLVLEHTRLVNPGLMQGVIRADPLQPADAVVVLAAAAQKDGELAVDMQYRVLKAYELLGQGFAPRMVLTQQDPPVPSTRPAIEAQMKALGLDFPIDEVAPVANTHDEAFRVAELARERGWKRVLLVTSPLHTRRAGAVFEKAGLPVICVPCVEGEYDLSRLAGPAERLRAFRDWLHEVIGIEGYRRRGWI
jgi:uncharacterized SAM-binding protein YcdF (DUF218 family)